MGYVISVILGYLMGCSSMAYYIGKWKKQDIREAGSGNLGASNTAVLFGWTAAVAVAVHDIGKAALAVLLCRWLFPDLEYAGAAAGVACVVGHIFPFYLKFKGGKGMASYFGVVLALNWKMALVLAVVMILITLITDYISLAAISMSLVTPAYTVIMAHNWILAMILAVGTGVMLYKHRENIVRIATHQEIGLRSTAKGEKRIDRK